MHVLAIDVGSYSVKYSLAQAERKRPHLISLDEEVIAPHVLRHPEMTLQEIQLSLIQDIIQEYSRPDTKILISWPQEYFTTRFLSLPVKNKKKAEMMIPFQLEEDIPYSINETHFASVLETHKSQTSAMVELIKISTFEEYFKTLKENNNLPDVLTSEASAMDNFFHQHPMHGPYCVLDIGHSTSTAYFFYNNKLMATNTNYFGGRLIDEMIAQNYRIDLAQAVEYKHQNAFLLTNLQVDGVDESQKDFAFLMEKTFEPIIQDFLRWKIGFKINYGLGISQVFVTGGTSNIKNFSSFLTEKLEIKVSLLESFDMVTSGNIDLNSKVKTRFALTSMLVQSFRSKRKLINILTGRYAQSSSHELPLKSYGFIMGRVSLLSFFIISSLIFHWSILNKDIKQTNAEIFKLTKNPSLNIPNRLKKSFYKNPEELDSYLAKSLKVVRQDISLLQASQRIGSLRELQRFSQMLKNSSNTLIEIKVDTGKQISASIKCDSLESLNKLKINLENSPYESVSVKEDFQDLTLQFTGVIP